MRRTRWVVVAALTMSVLAACGSNEPAAPTEETGAISETSASVADPLEGTWRTPTMSKDDHIAAVRAVDCPRELIAAHFADWPDDRTAVHLIEFEKGVYTVSTTFDGGAPEFEASGTYEVVDERSLMFTDSFDGTTTMFDYVLDDDELTLRMANTSCTEASDPAPFYIFQGAPFERATSGAIDETGASAVDPLEGTWTTVLTPELEELAAEEAGLEVIPHEEMWGGDEPVTIALTFENGQMVHTWALEDTEPEVGWSGEYEIVDEDTFVAGDTGNLYIEYEFSIEGDQLVIDMVRDDYPTASEDELAGEIYAQTVIYESAPFTRET